MKKATIYSLIAVSIGIMFGCSGEFQTYDLSEEYATSLHYEGTDGQSKSEEEEEKSDLVGVPALTYYNGDLKRGAIWWAGEDISLEKGPVFIIEADNIGPKNTPFGATFPPIDLISKEVMIKVTARAESADSVMPVLYLQVDDASGYQANANRPFHKIHNSQEFKDYYFDVKDIYTQILPKKHKVNGAMINSLKFFINPGQTGFTGTIYIKEIKVVPAESMPVE